MPSRIRDSTKIMVRDSGGRSRKFVVATTASATTVVMNVVAACERASGLARAR